MPTHVPNLVLIRDECGQFTCGTSDIEQRTLDGFLDGFAKTMGQAGMSIPVIPACRVREIGPGLRHIL